MNKPMKTQKWEYFSYKTSKDSDFCTFGDLGWECYAVDNGVAFFKRKVN